MTQKAEQERFERVNKGFESLLEKQRVTATITCPICHASIEFAVTLKQSHWKDDEMDIDIPVGQVHLCSGIAKTRDHAHSTMYTELERHFDELDSGSSDFPQVQTWIQPFGRSNQHGR